MSMISIWYTIEPPLPAKNQDVEGWGLTRIDETQTENILLFLRLWCSTLTSVVVKDLSFKNKDLSLRLDEKDKDLWSEDKDKDL